MSDYTIHNLWPKPWPWCVRHKYKDGAETICRARTELDARWIACALAAYQQKLGFSPFIGEELAQEESKHGRGRNEQD